MQVCDFTALFRFKISCKTTLRESIR
uniref:Uncharacterized protein n=1 Tax=Rhizophora mucronata TaxID=61149 RepID=A0A2P2NQL4_RHIMU